MVGAGSQLASTFNQVSTQLATISGQASQQYAALTGPSGQVQDYANQVAKLNEQIKLSLEAGQQPNDMLDRRDQLLDKLSSLAKVTVSQQPDGTDTVSFGDAARPLVERIDRQLAADVHAGRRRTARGAARPVQPDRRAGRLPVGARSTSPRPWRAPSTRCTPPRRSSRARPPRRSRWRSLPLRYRPPRRPPLVATTSRWRSPTCAAASADQGYAALVAQVGSDVQTAQDDQTNSQTMVTSIDNQRQSVSGVSLDEEMTNLISFQRGYQASARTLTTMDSMLDTLINHTGLVGL